MMGCPECRSLSDEHEPGCTWKQRNPTVGGIDPNNWYYAVAVYVGEEFAHLKGKRAKVYESKEGAEWCEATFLDPCTIPAAVDEDGVARWLYDGMSGRFLFKCRDFLTDDQRDPLQVLRELRGDHVKKRDTTDRIVDLEALGASLGLEGGHRIIDVPMSDLIHDHAQRNITEGVNPEIINVYFCTPEDAALTYSLWDMNNSVKLSTPKEFDRTYPDALRLHSWLRFHKNTIVNIRDWERAAMFKQIAIWGLVTDVAIIAGGIAFVTWW